MLFDVQCEVSAVSEVLGFMTSADAYLMCFLKSTITAQTSTDKLYGDADFLSQQDLASAHTAKGT